MATKRLPCHQLTWAEGMPKTEQRRDKLERPAVTRCRWWLMPDEAFAVEEKSLAGGGGGAAGAGAAADKEAVKKSFAFD